MTFIAAGSESNRKLARWWSIVNEFDYEIEYVQGKSNIVADALSRLTIGSTVFSGETLELELPVSYTIKEKTCDYCAEEFDWCDKCGKRMCLICELGSPSHLPFLYCKSCAGQLDSKDPTMNLPLLRLLVGDEPKDVLVDVGYEKLAALQGVCENYSVTEGRLWKHFKDRLKEIPSVAKRAELLTDIHTTGGHVGVMKLYHMARSLYYWPGLM